MQGRPGSPPSNAEDADLVCPISLLLFEDPVEAADGFLYDRGNIQRHIDRQSPSGKVGKVLSPVTLKPFKHHKLKPREDILKRVADWRAIQQGGRDQLHVTLQTLRSEVFESLDRFCLPKDVVLPEFRMPAMIVLGNESVGKSTLLERLVGFPILPRDRDVCTRMPVRVTLRRCREAQSAEVSVWRRVGKGELEQETKPPWYVALDRASAVVRDLMDEAVRSCGKEYETEKELRVTVLGPKCPNVTILDLPGVIATPSGRDLTEALAERYIKEERGFAMFLLVHSAIATGRDCLAASLIERYGLEKDTLGVFTKLDQILPEEDDITNGSVVTKLLTGGDKSGVKLPAGRWLGCASRPNSKVLAAETTGSREVMRLLKLDESERKVIKKLIEEEEEDGTPSVLPELHGRLGINNVRHLVESAFEAFITERWIPSVKEMVSVHAGKFLRACVDLGLPLPLDERYKQLIEQVSKHSPEHGVQLCLSSAKELRSVLAARARHLFEKGSVQWFNVMSGEGMVAKEVRELVDFALETQSARGNMFMVANELQSATDKLSSLCNKLVGALVNLHPVLASKFVEQLFKKETPSLLPIAFDSAVFESLDNHRQEQIAKLNRFRHNLGPELQQHLIHCLRDASDDFARSAALLQSRIEGIVYMELECGEETAELHIKAEKVHRLWKDILQLWLLKVANQVSRFVAVWKYLDESAPSEDCASERVELLQQSIAAFSVVQTLKALEAKFRGAPERDLILITERRFTLSHGQKGPWTRKQFLEFFKEEAVAEREWIAGTSKPVETSWAQRCSPAGTSEPVLGAPLDRKRSPGRSPGGSPAKDEDGAGDTHPPVTMLPRTHRVRAVSCIVPRRDAEVFVERSLSEPATLSPRDIS
eukprot:Hpha_TRINITY_DN16813_c0_g2::TRINITY_DN16813_c0_g2_i1::g.152053::m.152053